MRRSAYLVGGLLLLAASALAMVHGMRASLAQWTYQRAKYGPDKDLDTQAVLRRCEYAHSLYPLSFRICAFAADRAYRDRFDGRGEVLPERLAAARLWCDRGLELVFQRRHRRMREIEARLTARESPREGMLLWKDFVEWEFWEEGNQAVLADLQIGAGDYEGALATMQWARRSPHHRTLRRRLAKAWRRERRPPGLPE